MHHTHCYPTSRIRAGISGQAYVRLTNLGRVQIELVHTKDESPIGRQELSNNSKEN